MSELEHNEGAKPHRNQDKLDEASYALLDAIHAKLSAIAESLEGMRAPYKAWSALDEAIERARLVLNDEFPGYSEREGGEVYAKSDKLMRGDDGDAWREVAMAEYENN